MKERITVLHFFIYVAIIGIALTGCKKQSIQESELPVINVAETLENPSNIKLSDLGNKITYIPLELTDSALVGARPDGFVVTSKYIFVSNNGFFKNPDCLAFDRETGNFIGSIGHKGQDPQAFLTPTPVMDNTTDKVTFPGMFDNLVAYNPDGKFSGRIPLPFSARNINTYVFDKENIVVYDGADFSSTGNNILKLSSDGVLLDSIRVFDKSLFETLDKGDEVNSIAVGNTIGTLPGMVLINEYSNETETLRFENFRWLWNFDNTVRFYDHTRDTIYNYTDNKLIPKYAVNLGGNYSNKNYGEVKAMSKMPIIRTFFENSDIMLFMGNAGIYTGQFFAGIYNKADNTTFGGIITKAKFQTDGFENDIDGFMPVLITAMTENGEFAGMLTMEQIQAWMEAHPDFRFPQDIAWIKDLPEDSNPIVAIISK